MIPLRPGRNPQRLLSSQFPRHRKVLPLWRTLCRRQKPPLKLRRRLCNPRKRTLATSSGASGPGAIIRTPTPTHVAKSIGADTLGYGRATCPVRIPGHWNGALLVAVWLVFQHIALVNCFSVWALLTRAACGCRQRVKHAGGSTTSRDHGRWLSARARTAKTRITSVNFCHRCVASTDLAAHHIDVVAPHLARHIRLHRTWRYTRPCR
jgi:hypothetical protein